MKYTPQELMVVCAARQIQNHEKVFVGTRLPMLAFALAKRTHAPDCIGLFEEGILRDTPSAQFLYTIGDPPNIAEALWTTRTANIMGLLASGEVEFGFIGGAQIDCYGNLNTSTLGNWHRPLLRMPGSGGAADIVSFAQRYAIIMPHDRRRLCKKVNYITSPGYGYPTEEGPAGVGWRKRAGLSGGGPSALITTLAVFTFDSASGMAQVQSYHPGVDRTFLQQQTGWPVYFASDCTETTPPTQDELRIVRECDPDGIWIR